MPSLLSGFPRSGKVLTWLFFITTVTQMIRFFTALILPMAGCSSLQHTPSYQAYGFNFAKGFERVTVRGELAVKKHLLFSIDPDDSSYKEDSDGLVDRNLYQGVIGIDRTFFTNLYVNFQFFANFIEDGQESLAAERKTHGFTFEISDKFLDDDLSAGFRGTYYTSNDGSVLEIFAEYKIGDNWQIAPGCLLFNGSQNSRLGQYSKNDMVYLRLRFSF